MKAVLYIIELAFTIAMTFGACTYAGYYFGNIVIGIFAGFILSMAYLIWAVYKDTTAHK